MSKNLRNKGRPETLPTSTTLTTRKLWKVLFGTLKHGLKSFYNFSQKHYTWTSRSTHVCNLGLSSVRHHSGSSKTTSVQERFRRRVACSFSRSWKIPKTSLFSTNRHGGSFWHDTLYKRDAFQRRHSYRSQTQSDTEKVLSDNRPSWDCSTKEEENRKR